MLDSESTSRVLNFFLIGSRSLDFWLSESSFESAEPSREFEEATLPITLPRPFAENLL